MTLHAITFDDLTLEMKEDSVFDESLLTDRVKELLGKRIRMRAFMYGGAILKPNDLDQFIVVINLECKYGPGALAFHNLVVECREGITADYSTRPIEVEGILSLRPFTGPDDKTYSIYHLDCTAVTSFPRLIRRRRTCLPPQPIASRRPGRRIVGLVG